jgi:CheY-like chemotaxis protein
MPAMTAADDASCWPPGPGVMAARVRSHDWSATPLGAIGGWPAALRTAVEICLDSALPMAVLWGGALTVLPNDALAARIAGDASSALGEAYREVQPEAWAALADPLVRLFETGEPQTLPGFWRGPREAGEYAPRPGETATGAAFACTALRDADGAVAGLLACGLPAPLRPSRDARDVREMREARDVREAIERLAHALRDPMAQLREALDLLRPSRDGHERARVHELLERQVLALDRAIVGMLDRNADVPAPGAVAHDERPTAAQRGGVRGDDLPPVDPARGLRLATMPAAPDDDEDDDGEFLMTDESTGPVHRILVVDDQRDDANELATLLEQLGAEVKIAHDFDWVFVMVDGWLPEAVMIDLERPDLDGLDIARCLREQPGMTSVPLIALTGRGHATDLRLTREAGIDQHLVKPLRREVLASMLEALDDDGDEAGDAVRH